MGENTLRNWDLREFRVRVNLPSPIWQVQVTIRSLITPIRGLPNPIRQAVPLISHIRWYPPHRSHLHPPSLSSSSTILPSSQNTKLNHPSVSLHAMIMSSHRVQHTLSTASTEYSIHRVQHPPKIVCLPFILMITSWPLSVASASGVPPYMIDRHLPAWHESSKVKSSCHIPTVVSWLTDERGLSTRHTVNRPPPSTRLNSLNHGRQVYLHSRSIMAPEWNSKLTGSWPPNLLDYGLHIPTILASQVHFQIHSITASKCISKLPQSRPRSASISSLDHGHQTRSIPASKFAWSWPPSASPSSLHHGLEVHLKSRSIMACEVHVQTRTIMASKFARLSPPSASRNSLNQGL